MGEGAAPLRHNLASIYDTQEMTSEEEQLHRLCWVADGYIAVAVRILERAQRSCKEMCRGLPFPVDRAWVTQWACLRIERTAHQRDANLRIRELALRAYGYFDLFEGLKYGGVVFAPDERTDYLPSNGRVQELRKESAAAICLEIGRAFHLLPSVGHEHPLTL